LDPNLEKMLDDVARDTGEKRSDLVREALRRHLALRQFEKIRRKTVPYARRAGYITDEDVFRDIS
jgi:metal-responsive CopG/Arc/MetJ family transcriptional regulator